MSFGILSMFCKDVTHIFIVSLHLKMNYEFWNTNLIN